MTRKIFQKITAQPCTCQRRQEHSFFLSVYRRTHSRLSGVGQTTFSFPPPVDRRGEKLNKRCSGTVLYTQSSLQSDIHYKIYVQNTPFLTVHSTYSTMPYIQPSHSPISTIGYMHSTLLFLLQYILYGTMLCIYPAFTVTF